MGTIARFIGVLFVFSAIPAIAAPPPRGGDFEYSADGQAERTTGGRKLNWELPGKVSALDRVAAEAKANAEIDQFLEENYLRFGFKEVPKTRYVRIRRVAVSNAGPNHTTFRLNVRCLAYVKQRKSELTVFNWDVITKEVITDKFTVRLIVSHDGKEQPYETEIRTQGRGKPGETIHTFDVWAGNFVKDDPPLDFSVLVLHKNLPNLDRFAQPPKPNPTDPNDGFTAVGSFRVRLSHQGERMVATWIPIGNATTPDRPRPGPGLLSQRFVLKKSKAVPFAVAAFAVKESEAREARDALLAADWEKHLEMRQKLEAAGPEIKVFTGVAEGKAPGVFGRPAIVGTTRLVVLSANRKAAEAYIAKEFPREKERRTVVIAATEDDAKTALRDAFSKEYPNGRLEGEPQLIPKIGRTLRDKLLESPANPPR